MDVLAAAAGDRKRKEARGGTTGGNKGRGRVKNVRRAEGKKFNIFLISRM